MVTDHPTVEETAALAGMLHAAQTDKSGEPYIGHLGRVARNLLRLYPDASLTERHAVWLHDTIEDTTMTAQGLVARGYDPDIVAVVTALTRPEDGRSYQQWIEALADSAPVSALRVKRADLADNSDPARLGLLPPDTAASLARRYARAIETIDAAILARSRIDNGDDDGDGADRC
ncbi:HD domain-containing protein [Frigidibacter oleivorans]|uniref:HD domain-containing protein n=1 Tax=Frigidibacter oleivorans TaxID=2487129 RepID=UPI000F8D6CC0|nr:HD domain-containing protein [Frigidibacter oleivorans]